MQVRRMILTLDIEPSGSLDLKSLDMLLFEFLEVSHVQFYNIVA